MKLKPISLLLAAVLLLSCLAGCGTKEAIAALPTEVPEETPAAEAGASVEETDGAVEETDGTVSAEMDFQAAYESHDPDETVMTVNGRAVTWGEYYAWLYQAANQLCQYFTISDWNAEFAEAADMLDDPTYGNYVLSYAFSNAMQCAVIAGKADEAGIRLSEDQQAEVDATMDSYASQFGGEEGLEEYLASVYATTDFLRDQTELVSVYNLLFENTYGENGSALSEEEAIAYVKEQGYMYAKHILFKTVDDENAPLDEETAAQKKADAERVLAQLQEASPEELPALFDSLMLEYSEDTGSVSYPDGYYFLSGEFVPEFEAAVLALEENGLSGLVESDYGYHIIFCPPMSADHIIGYDSYYEAYGARDLASAALFNDLAQSWYDGATVIYSEGFDTLDLNELFMK